MERLYILAAFEISNKNLILHHLPMSFSSNTPHESISISCRTIVHNSANISTCTMWMTYNIVQDSTVIQWGNYLKNVFVCQDVEPAPTASLAYERWLIVHAMDRWWRIRSLFECSKAAKNMETLHIFLKIWSRSIFPRRFIFFTTPAFNSGIYAGFYGEIDFSRLAQINGSASQWCVLHGFSVTA